MGEIEELFLTEEQVQAWRVDALDGVADELWQERLISLCDAWLFQIGERLITPDPKDPE